MARIENEGRNRSRPLVLYAMTTEDTLRLLDGQLRYLRNEGFDVTYVASAGRIREEVSGQHFGGLNQGVRTIEVAMTREIAPLQDLVSLWRLCRLMRALRPAVANVGTPKAGLLAGFAAWVNRVPCRVYTLRGLRFETMNGVRRLLLIYTERLACRFAHPVICVSQSLREKAIAFGLSVRERTVVFGSGSSNGVE